MALNSSGPISLAGATAGQSIAVELGLSSTGQISLNDSAVRTLAGVASGAIVMPTDFYGKSNAFVLTISTNQTNLNLRSAAVTAGWNTTTKVNATINSGVYVSSNATGTPALVVNGSWPGGVTLVNNGTIVGMGGAGGAGSGSTGGAGSAGGTALSVSSAITITNNGVIAGGGGGGGGGAGGSYTTGSAKAGYSYYSRVGGGGGGGQSSNAANSAGGYNGGGAGTLASAGGGGSGGSYASIYAGYGGSGGGWGSSGAAGGSSGGSGGSYPGGSGGAGGNAVSGNSNITWVTTGTRYGAIT